MYNGLEVIAGIILWPQRGRVEGIENLPPPPFILALNHLTPYDPMLLILALLPYLPKRKIFFLTQKEIALIFAPWQKLLGMIPASYRGLDRAAEYLQSGQLVGIFIMGAKSFFDTSKIRRYSGAAILAQKTGLPVVPVTVKGKPAYYCSFWRFLWRAARSLFEKKDFFVHPPIVFGTDSSIRETTNLILRIIESEEE